MTPANSRDPGRSPRRQVRGVQALRRSNAPTAPGSYNRLPPGRSSLVLHREIAAARLRHDLPSGAAKAISVALMGLRSLLALNTKLPGVTVSLVGRSSFPTGPRRFRIKSSAPIRSAIARIAGSFHYSRGILGREVQLAHIFLDFRWITLWVVGRDDQARKSTLHISKALGAPNLPTGVIRLKGNKCRHGGERGQSWA